MLSFGPLRGGAGPNAAGVPDAIGAGEEKKVPPLLPRIPLECEFYDVEQVHHLTLALLVTLAAACVEKMTGAPFSRRAAVVPDVKEEMLEYLHQQSKAYAGGSASQGMGQVLTPSKVADNIFESFIESKKNLLSRVSSKIIDSGKKEDKIDDFVQELDRTGVWMGGQREVMAKVLLKRVDQSKSYHCEMKFKTNEELTEHQASCVLRPLTCPNEGCSAVHSAVHADAHDASCLHKLLLCELRCGSMVPRWEMDRHGETVCPMKQMKCPFHPVGCLHAMAQRLLEQHCTDYMGQHLLETLQYVQNHEVVVGSHAQRIVLLEKALQIAQRSEAVDMGAVLLTVKEQAHKVQMLEAEVKRLRADLKGTNVSAEILQLRRELRNLQKQVESRSLHGSAAPSQ